MVLIRPPQGAVPHGPCRGVRQPMSAILLVSFCLLAGYFPGDKGASDQKYPLDAPLRVLAEDVKSPRYRKLVTEKMLQTDLAAEWQRVETADNAESFLQKHGDKEKVTADAELRRAYER